LERPKNFDKIDLLIFVIIGIGFIGLILSLFLSNSALMIVYCSLIIALFVGIILGKNVFSLPNISNKNKDKDGNENDEHVE